MLYIVATPIGNPMDISERAKNVLAEVDFILCEDTRRTTRLLHSLSIAVPHLVSCHAHNESKRTERALQELQFGKKGAYVSDAGTPAVSDPGMRLVAAALANGIAVEPLPGPSAVSVALSASGFETPPYHFLGFPPRKEKAKESWLIEASHLAGVIVLFEAGNRFASLVETLQKIFPEREMCMCRELTKTHQEILRKPVLQFEAKDVLGEVTLVIGPGEPYRQEDVQVQSLKTIAQQLADEWGISKREAYNLLMKVKPEVD